MPSKKAAVVGLDELRWMTKSEAMAWVRRGERAFDQDFGCKVTRYTGANGFLYDKKELDRLQMRMVEISHTCEVINS